MNHFCPYCGSNSRLLFNLVACVTPGCRNYEETWHRDWIKNNRPTFSHTSWTVDDKFVGCFVSKQKSKFDLYTCSGPNGVKLGLARYGSSEEQCYYVDENETEIGNIITGPVVPGHKISSCLVEALKASLKRIPKNK